MKNDSTNVLRLAAEDLACYAIALWPGFELAAHHRIIVEKLEAIERGEIRRLIICMPPQHGKSLLATQLFPAWYLGRHPDRAVITASYGQELADDFGRRVRGFVSDPVHRAIFPGSRLSESSASMRRFNTTQGGTYYAVGRGGPITGRGAALLVIDDPIKDREEAQSETVRRSLFEWYQTVAYTRLRPTAPIVLIQTRWHADDLAGRLLRDCSDNWEILSLPAIAETDETFRHAGEALRPQKFSLEDLKRIRAVIGGPAFVSLYQQNPSAAEGAIFRRAWWQFFREPPVFLRVLQSWDTGFKTGTENDYSVCTTWGVAENGYYLLWLWRDRVEFPELKKRIAWMAEQYKPAQILIEDQSSGQSAIQELQYASVLPIIPVKVDRDKSTRARAVTPLIEAGKVFLPESAPWLNEYVDELAGFPTAAHDDAVDSTTQALNYLRHQPVNEVRWTPVRL